MDNISHVMLEHSSSCDTVRASSLINLTRQNLFLNANVTVDIFSLYLGH